MLGSQTAQKKLAQALTRSFSTGQSLVSSILGSGPSSRTSKDILSLENTVALKGHQPINADEIAAQYQVTQLQNGFQVLTESQTFPGAVHLGFLINVGTRDEVPVTSGSCLALKNTYLKTLKHTNETINYGMIQMSGGDFTMDYDQERMYFRGHCIEYDVSDMFQMMVDCALEPRSVLAANVARAKNAKSIELRDHLSKFDPFYNNSELLLRTAFGYNTLGMPKYGNTGGIDNIDARSLQQFMMQTITPKKCLIVASGVQNHQEVVELVKERIGEIHPVPEHMYQREAAQYIGGEYRTWTETPQTNITLAFESVNWQSHDIFASAVASEIFGSANSQQLNAPGQGYFSRASRNLVQKHTFVDAAQPVNLHFSDSGLFGISIEGPGAQSADLMRVAVEELHGLKSGVTHEELQRAKNSLKMSIALTQNDHANRLEEVARNYSTFGELTFHQFAEKIDNVTIDDVQSYVSRVTSGKPTLLVTGGAINLVPSASDVQKMLN